MAGIKFEALFKRVDDQLVILASENASDEERTEAMAVLHEGPFKFMPRIYENESAGTTKRKLKNKCMDAIVEIQKADAALRTVPPRLSAETLRAYRSLLSGLHSYL